MYIYIHSEGCVERKSTHSQSCATYLCLGSRSMSFWIWKWVKINEFLNLEMASPSSFAQNHVNLVYPHSCLITSSGILLPLESRRDNFMVTSFRLVKHAFSGIHTIDYETRILCMFSGEYPHDCCFLFILWFLDVIPSIHIHHSLVKDDQRIHFPAELMIIIIRSNPYYIL